MSESEVLVRVEDGVGRLSLNRPKALNALTDALGIKDIAMPATAERVWRVANGIA